MKKKIKVKVDKSLKDLPRWDLSVAYYKGLNDPQIDKDRKELKRLSKELARYRGLIYYLEPYQLSILLRKYEEMIELSRKLSFFAFLYSDTHKTDEKAAQFEATITEKMDKYFEDLGFIQYELNGLPEFKMEEFLNHPKLQRWLSWLTRLFNSYWTLNEAATFIIDKKSLVSSSWARLYEETCGSLKFSLGGKTLNEAEIISKSHDPNPDVRQKAMLEMNRVYKKNANVITMCYNMILKDRLTDDELYGYDEPVEQSLAHNHMSKEDLLNMSNAVVDSYIPISQRYYKLLAKLMGQDQISYADRNHNPIGDSDKQYTWPECVEKVLTAYADFSVDYFALAMQILQQPLVDVPPAKGKKSGAYCVRGAHPYIFLNFTGKEHDINTFAHELGHGVHHLLQEKVGTLNNSTPTSLSEVASEFAESLLFKEQLDEAETDREKLRLYVQRVSEMVSSIHRQIAFYKFEERCHHERMKGEISTKRFNQIWREEASRYLGFDVGEEAEYLWMGISHLFSTPYYVYSYAFAGLIVNNLVRTYEKWEEESEFERREAFADLYLDMLSETGVEHFVSLLEPFDIDASAPDFWKKGLKLITRYLDEIEKLAKKEKLI